MNSTQHDRPEFAVRAPRSAAWLAAACALVAASSAGAQVLKSKPVTGGLESGTDLVTLPAQPSGSIAVRECRDCPSLRLEFDSSTRYFIGKEPVSYARLREAAAKGDLRLNVSYRLGTRTLTRLRLAAAVNTQ
jgi:hypothetical protein